MTKAEHKRLVTKMNLVEKLLEETREGLPLVFGSALAERLLSMLDDVDAVRRRLRGMVD